MPGRRKPKPLSSYLKSASIFLVAILAAEISVAGELRRSMSFIRPLLMGDAYVAVADEASTLFYNPAGIVRLPENSVEFPTFQFLMDERIRKAITDPESLSGEFEGVDETNFRSRLNETVFFDFNMRFPVIVRAESDVAFGLGVEVLTFFEILGNPVFPGLHLEFFADQVLFLSLGHRLSENLAFAYTPKIINRIGIDKFLTFGEIFAAGSTASIENDPAFKDLSEGKNFTKFGMDIGFLYKFQFWKSWFPRGGLSFLNIGGVDDSDKIKGIEFGPRPSPFEPPQAGELPQINTFGFAVSPVFTGIRYTIALDVVDFTRTVLPGKDWKKRSRLGVEIGIGPRKDGTALLAILAGLNASHFSFGVLSRVWIYEIGFGSYTVELGNEAGDKPSDRFAFIFGFRF
ncbi:MAG: hypothetical protein IIA14_03475 [SAR324 cluster bacterium]|nr:hypothetical protein [SAR324 cluster bacterium]